MTSEQPGQRGPQGVLPVPAWDAPDPSEPPGDPFGHASVTFTARWKDSRGIHEHRERSIFVQRSGHWYFIDPGIALTAGRNDPCPCGSGGKFKKCCADYL